MAVALILMALAQLMVAIGVTRAARETAEIARDFSRDLRPIVDKLNKITDDAAKVASLALVQAERIDTLVASTAERVDDTLSIVQTAVLRPVRHGTAIMAGVRAAFAAFRRPPARPRHVRDDEDALFIG
jgi:hypothetical protein